MSRPHTQVRRTTPEQFDDFVALWLSARIECASTMDPTTRSLGEERVREALTHSDLRSYLAYVDGRPVGFMVLGQASLFSFTDTPCVCVDQLYVVPEARRAGVARSLLGAAAAYAELLGSEQVATSVPTQARDTNRFFARLGFTPLVVRRVASTVGLRRKLATMEEKQPKDVVLLHRRRSSRARAVRAAAFLR